MTKFLPLIHIHIAIVLEEHKIKMFPQLYDVPP